MPKKPRNPSECSGFELHPVFGYLGKCKHCGFSAAEHSVISRTDTATDVSYLSIEEKEKLKHAKKKENFDKYSEELRNKRITQVTEEQKQNEKLRAARKAEKQARKAEKARRSSKKQKSEKTKSTGKKHVKNKKSDGVKLKKKKKKKTPKPQALSPNQQTATQVTSQVAHERTMSSGSRPRHHSRTGSSTSRFRNSGHNVLQLRDIKAKRENSDEGLMGHYRKKSDHVRRNSEEARKAMERIQQAHVAELEESGKLSADGKQGEVEEEEEKFAPNRFAPKKKQSFQNKSKKALKKLGSYRSVKKLEEKAVKRARVRRQIEKEMAADQQEIQDNPVLSLFWNTDITTKPVSHSRMPAEEVGHKEQVSRLKKTESDVKESHHESLHDQLRLNRLAALDSAFFSDSNPKKLETIRKQHTTRRTRRQYNTLTEGMLPKPKHSHSNSLGLSQLSQFSRARSMPTPNNIMAPPSKGGIIGKLRRALTLGSRSSISSRGSKFEEGRAIPPKNGYVTSDNPRFGSKSGTVNPMSYYR